MKMFNKMLNNLPVTGWHDRTHVNSVGYLKMTAQSFSHHKFSAFKVHGKCIWKEKNTYSINLSGWIA